MLEPLEHVELIRRQALAEVEWEQRLADVAAEKARILAERRKPIWLRLLAWLPFTITWKTK